jgi:hypothetical protein
MFNVGDRVQAISAPDHNSSYIGKVGVVAQINSNRTARLLINVHFDGYGTYWCEKESLKIISSTATTKVTNMSIISQFKNILRSEPNKTFVKIGILDDKEVLTQDGKDLLLNYLLSKNQDDFNTTVAQPILAEQLKEEAK